MAKRVQELHVFLSGGLGNQLFQYASGRALALTYDQKLILRQDLLPPSPDKIGQISRWPNQIQDFNHGAEIWTTSFQPKGDTNFFGKWMDLKRRVASHFPSLPAKFGSASSDAVLQARKGKIAKKFFELNTTAFCKELLFGQEEELKNRVFDIIRPSRNFLEMMDSIQRQKILAVHIRQGDFKNLVRQYGSIDKQYFKKAIGIQHSEFSYDATWVFTDSENVYVDYLMKENLITRVITPEDMERPLENLLLLSSTEGLVASNSTFSWWSMFLGSRQRQVIAPAPEQALYRVFSPSDSRIGKVNFLEC